MRFCMAESSPEKISISRTGQKSYTKNIPLQSHEPANGQHRLLASERPQLPRKSKHSLHLVK